MRLLLVAALMLAAPVAAVDDPHIWLEDISGEKSLAWVRQQNARTLPALEAVPGFAGWRARAEQILQDPRRIAWPSGAAPSPVTETHVFNLWRDDTHVRGLWRTSPRAAYDAGAPVWTTLIDLDALETAEGRNLQFNGATCLPPESNRCLVQLSVGGSDSVEVREYDTAARRFIAPAEGGFFSPDAKQTVAWLDANRLLIATAAGPATTSGYAREVRLWQRGTPLSAARLLLAIPQADMGAFPSAWGEGESRRAIIDQRTSFWSGRIHHVMADGSRSPSPLPDDADFKFIASPGAPGASPRAFALLRSDFAGIPKGSLVSYTVPANGSPGPVTRVFTPGPTQAIAGVDASGRALYLSLLDNVAARLLRLTPTAGEQGADWQQADIALPANSALDLVATDAADSLYLNVQGFTEPARLMRATDGAPPAVLASAPAFFDAANFEVSQRFATAKDSTMLPYFLVRPKGATGPLRTLAYGYGGFEIPVTPSYASPLTQFWLEQGNQYVVTNIRGGGEYGPRWHQAALLEKRQTSYDDLHAIAETLKSQGLASKLAVIGGSNGGLMASVAFTQRPDLYDGAVVLVPLADMRRYHKLLAGASWMAEYGNPDTEDWAFIGKYSPYQNLRAEAKYPAVFFHTSTKDDRVHPGHARKMVARLREQGHRVHYYENVDGGHAGVANLKEAAYRAALILAYLDLELK